MVTWLVTEMAEGQTIGLLYLYFCGLGKEEVWGPVGSTIDHLF